MKTGYTLLFALAAFQLALGQERAELLNHDAVFEQNRGQWEGDFNYRLALKTGALFFENGSYSVRLMDPEEWSHTHEDEHHTDHPRHEEQRIPIARVGQLAYRVKWHGASPDAEKIATTPRTDVRNYFRGNDPSRWVTDNKLYQELRYESIYPEIDLELYSKGDHFKYDFVVHPGGDPDNIRWSVEGTEMRIAEGRLIYKTPFEDDVTELAPVAYQVINGRKYHVPAAFRLENGVASFQLGHYDPNYTLIIDPEVVFSTYSGSTADNWGFTATYSADGGLYGGGITFGVGYPATLGAYDRTYNPGPNSNDIYIDATISKYTPDGSNLVYATYLGGAESDQPHSMIENSQGQLVVYGATGSPDFPTTPGAASRTFGGGPMAFPFDENSPSQHSYYFPQGVDCFVAVLSAGGNALLGSTFLGGNASDGINQNIQRNYGDGSRGEIVVDANDNIYVTSTTFSTDFPLVNTSVTGKSGACDATVTKFNPGLTSILWSTLYGGTGSDQGYGIVLSSTGDVFITGGTNSNNLPGTQNGLISSAPGGIDGYIAKFQPNGNLLTATYMGTTSYDQSFLIQVDRNDAVYVFGQSQGSYPRTAGTWRSGNTRQFIHKLTNDLSSTIFSTSFGSTSNSAINLVPTAFNVDDCLNIMLSGWGGQVNGGGNNLGGTTTGLPTTTDGYQRSTDGSDFYFLVLAHNASSLTYATFFGGSGSAEHVDGGTSRFSPSGEIYQAVCAGCGGNSLFPTTPGVFSPTNASPRCNLGTVKINFDVTILSDFGIDFTADVDTVCNTLNVKFTNDSRNANIYYWDFDNGQTSQQVEPTTSFTAFGTYVIELIAVDTVCNISDTSYLTLVHDRGAEPHAQFSASYSNCDPGRTVQLVNQSRGATEYHWDFGDGTTVTGFEPVHSYGADGTFTIQLVAEDQLCNKFDTITFEVNFNTNISAPVVDVSPSSCQNGRIDVRYQNDSSYYRYRWEWEDGTVEWNKFPDTKVSRTGRQIIRLTIVDDVCGQTFEYSFELDINRIDDRVYIPNAFSPNGDGINDVLELKGNECLRRSRFIILNRWGQEVFRTDRPFEEFWDGQTNESTLKQDTYVYRFHSEDGERSGFIVVLP